MNAIRDHSHSTHGRGFTLVEVLLSIGILGVGMAMIAAIFPVAAKEAQDASNTALGTVMCDNALAIVKCILSGGQRDSGTVTTAIAGTWPDTVAIPNVNYPCTNVTVSSSAGAALDQLVGSFLEIYTGTGAGQSGRIITATGNIATVSGVFSPMPDATSKYRIVQPRAAADSGLMSYPTFGSSFVSAVTDNTKLWSANQWAGWTLFLPSGDAGAATPSTFSISRVTRADMSSANPTIAHSDESIKIKLVGGTPKAKTGIMYQLVLLADENTCTNAATSVIFANTLHFPSGMDSSVNGTSRGCVVMTTKPIVSDVSAQPANMSSANGATIVVAAYSKSSRSNLVGWGKVMVTGVDNSNAVGPVVTISSGTLCLGSPLVFVENGAVAKITQVLTQIPSSSTGTAVLDRPMYMPRGAALAMALVVQEIPFKAGDPATGPFSGTPLLTSPAIAWKVSQSGSK